MFTWLLRLVRGPTPPTLPSRVLLSPRLRPASPEDRLWHAIDQDDPVALDAALAAGANIDDRRVKPPIGEICHTPLYEACHQDRLGLVHRLLAAGADPSVGQNPLAAIENENERAAEMACALLAVCPDLAKRCLATIRFDEFPSRQGLDCLKPRVRAAAEAFLAAQSLSWELPAARSLAAGRVSPRL